MLQPPRPGDLAQINLFAEQLDLSGGLLRQGGMARARMALVAIDNLAEVLLYRHAQFTFAASEELSSAIAVSRYDERQRERLRQFEPRVKLAMTEHTAKLTFGYPKPILDKVDAATFRVAHRYRNRVYHQDRHNDVLTEPLSRLYMAAVGRAWCRAQPSMATGGNPRRLRSLPYVLRHAGGPDGSHLSLPGAVEALVAELLKGLAVRAQPLAKRLAADLVERADRAEEARQELARSGLPSDTHADMLRAAELHDRYRADPELVRLEDAAAAIIQDGIDRPPDAPVDDLAARLRAVEEGQGERIEALRDGFRPRVGLRTPASIRRSAEKLRQVRDMPKLLTSYESADERMGLLESCLAWIDREWDRIVNREEEIRRGK